MDNVNENNQKIVIASREEVDANINEDGIVEEPAYLMVADKNIGVTDSLEEIFAYIKKSVSEGEWGKTFLIHAGDKTDLLQKENRLLIMDEIGKSANLDTVAIPQKFEKYHLTTRPKGRENRIDRVLVNNLNL